MPSKKTAAGGIYSMAIKSAAATVGVNMARANNDLQMTLGKEDALKMMHHTGDMLVKQNASVLGNGSSPFTVKQDS